MQEIDFHVFDEIIDAQIEVKREDLPILVRSLREAMGMSRAQFSDYYGVPFGTIKSWELGERYISVAMLRLMLFRARAEKMYQKNQVSTG